MRDTPREISYDSFGWIYSLKGDHEFRDSGSVLTRSRSGGSRRALGERHAFVPISLCGFYKTVSTTGR